MGGGGASVSELFTMNPNLKKIKKNFAGVGWGALEQVICFSKKPNLKKKKIIRGGGGGGEGELE